MGTTGPGLPTRQSRGVSLVAVDSWSGVLPEGHAAQTSLRVGRKEENKPAVLPLLPVTATFWPATAATPDAPWREAKGEQGGVVVEGEAERNKRPPLAGRPPVHRSVLPHIWR